MAEVTVVGGGLSGSEAAYQLYAERGCVDGLELDDWLQAEAEVDRMLGGQRAAH